MSGEETSRAPFDEATALAELEELRASIERARQRHKDVDAEFDRFVRGFKKVEEPAAPSTTQDPLLPFPSERHVRIPPVPWSVPAPRGVEPSASWSSFTVADLPTGLIASREPSRRPARLAGTIGIAAVVLAGAVFAIRTWRAAPQQPAAAVAPSAARTPAQSGAPTAHPAAPAAATPRTAITAIRPVWVRVIADGTRVLQRELQAGESVPLGDVKTIVIRAGDAGAVRVSFPGHDGPLGRDGEIVTRTLTVKDR